MESDLKRCSYIIISMAFDFQFELHINVCCKMRIRFEALISLAFLDSASNYYHDRCNEKYQNVVLLRLRCWRILPLSNLAFYKGTYCTLYWRPINVNKLTQYDFFSISCCYSWTLCLPHGTPHVLFITFFNRQNSGLFKCI